MGRVVIEIGKFTSIRTFDDEDELDGLGDAIGDAIVGAHLAIANSYTLFARAIARVVEMTDRPSDDSCEIGRYRTAKLAENNFIEAANAVLEAWDAYDKWLLSGGEPKQ